MGASSSQLQQSIPIGAEWTLVNPNSLPKIYRNLQGQLATEHVFSLGNRSDINTEMNIYRYRRYQRLNLVRVYGVDSNKTCSGCCSTSNYLRVLVEFLPFRLYEAKNYSFAEALYILLQAIPAAKEILKRIGPVRFEDSMIGVTEEGFIRFWVNSNFEENHPSKTHQLTGSPMENQNFMIKSLLNAVEFHMLGGKFPEYFTQQIETHEHFNFLNLQRAIEKFAEANRIIVPDRLKLVLQNQQFIEEIVTTVPGPLILPVQQPFATRNSYDTVVMNTSILNPVELVTEERVEHRVGETRYSMNQMMLRSNHFPNIDAPRIVSPTVYSRLPSIQEANNFHNVIDSQVVHSKRKYAGESVLTADKTFPSLNYTSHLLQSNFHPSLLPAYSNPPLLQESSTIPRLFPRYPIQSSINMIQNRDQLQAPRISSPFAYTDFSGISKRVFTPPRSQMIDYTAPVPIATDRTIEVRDLMAPINMTPINTTPMKPYQVVQEQEEQMCLTVTTYKVSPNITYQYRTIHPENLVLLAPNEQDPDIVTVKLPRNTLQSTADKNSSF